MVYIAYYTELNCNYAQQRHIFRESSKYAPDENFCCHFCIFAKSANFCHSGYGVWCWTRNITVLHRNGKQNARQMSLSCKAMLLKPHVPMDKNMRAAIQTAKVKCECYTCGTEPINWSRDAWCSRLTGRLEVVQQQQLYNWCIGCTGFSVLLWLVVCIGPWWCICAQCIGASWCSAQSTNDWINNSRQLLHLIVSLPSPSFVLTRFNSFIAPATVATIINVINIIIVNHNHLLGLNTKTILISSPYLGSDHMAMKMFAYMFAQAQC